MSIWKKLLGQPDYKKEDFEGPRYAKFTDRLFASAIDTAIIFILLTPVFAITHDMVMGDVSAERIFAEAQAIGVPEKAAEHISNSGIIGLMFKNSLVQYLISGVIMIAFWASFNTTPGKFLIGMKIIDVDTGGKPEFHQYLIRYGALLISLTPLFLGFVWAAFNKRKLAWHDMMADTAVVYTRKRLGDWFAERHFKREEIRAQMRQEREAAKAAEAEEMDEPAVEEEEKKKD